jgi:hypothetical protein
MKVRAGSEYFYHPNILDLIDGRTCLKSGDVVRVVNLPGCPKANTMGHAHIESITGEFVGLVHTNSLHTKAEYIEYLRDEIAKHEAKQVAV